METKNMAGLKVVCVSNVAHIPNLDAAGNPYTNQMLIDLLLGKTYDVLEERDGWYQIVDESGEDYWYPAEMFEVR